MNFFPLKERSMYISASNLIYPTSDTRQSSAAYRKLIYLCLWAKLNENVLGHANPWRCDDWCHTPIGLFLSLIWCCHAICAKMTSNDAHAQGKIAIPFISHHACNRKDIPIWQNSISFKNCVHCRRPMYIRVNRTPPMSVNETLSILPL